MFAWDMSFSEDNGSELASEDGNDLFFGAGIAITPNPSMTLKAEYKIFDIDGDDVSNWSLGLQFHF